jgi:transposase-like protein
MRTRRPRSAPLPRSAFAGFRFPPDVIVVAVRWYLRFGLSYRDVEVDHVSVYRWVQRFTPLLAEAARPCRHRAGDRWFADETYVKVAGRWRYVYRAIDQFGQVIDVFVSPRRDAKAACRFFKQAVSTTRVMPREVVTDRAPTYPVVLEDLLPAAWHRTDRYANNAVECDHGRLKARLGPMRGLKQNRNTRVIVVGHAFVQNVRRGHYELAVEEPTNRRLGGRLRQARLSDLIPIACTTSARPGWRNATAPTTGAWMLGFFWSIPTASSRRAWRPAEPPVPRSRTIAEPGVRSGTRRFSTGGNPASSPARGIGGELVRPGFDGTPGQWQVPWPASVKVLPGSGRKRQS